MIQEARCFYLFWGSEQYEGHHFIRNSAVDVLEYQFSLYPRHITEDSFRQWFGSLDDSVIIVHVRQLIADGLVEPPAVMKMAVKEMVFPEELS